MKKKFFGFLTAVLTLGVLGGTAFAAAGGGLQRTDSALAGTVQGHGAQDVRIWFSEDSGNKISQANAVIKVWCHRNQNDSNAGEYVYSVNNTDSNSVINKYVNQSESSRIYWYFDIPSSFVTNGWYWTIQRFSTSGDFWNGLPNVQFKEENINKIHFVWKNWSDYSYGGFGDKNCDPGLAAKALEGISVCSDSKINGYNAFPTFSNTFVKSDQDDVWRVNGNLGGHTVKSFTEKSAWKGKAISDKNHEVDAWTQYEALKLNYETNGKHLSTKFNSSFVNDLSYVVVIISICLVVTSIFVIYRRKKVQ